MKEVVAELTLENRLLKKKHARGWRRGLRYSASEKAEIIKTVESSHLPVKQTLAMLDIARSTFYRWYELWLEGGVDTLEDQSPKPNSVWNKIADARRQAFIEFALSISRKSGHHFLGSEMRAIQTVMRI